MFVGLRASGGLGFEVCVFCVSVRLRVALLGLLYEVCLLRLRSWFVGLYNPESVF